MPFCASRTRIASSVRCSWAFHSNALRNMAPCALMTIVRLPFNFTVEECMNSNKILLVNVSKGIIGDDVCTVLGSFLITTIQAVAMGRATMPVHERRPFYLFIDEAHNFVSSAFSTMLSQVRKFGVGVFLANQLLDQFAPDVKNAIIGSVGTWIVFRIGLSDAKVMEKEFFPVLTYDDFVSLPKYHIYIKLLIDGTESKGF